MSISSRGLPAVVVRAALWSALVGASLVLGSCSQTPMGAKCAADSECSGSTPVCDTTRGACVGCTGDSSCALGSVCAQGACVEGCSASHACQAGAECCSSQCVVTATDVQHCGGCNACPTPASANAAAVCNNGVCGFGPCAAGFADCNNDRADGCETNLMGAAACACVPGQQADCYDGPVGTLGVGACVGGKKTCNPSGVGYGACVGQVLPAAETCNTGVDDDCNGQVNEGGAGCVCAPSSTASCYGGPAGTQGVGACVAGVKTCNALGTGYGGCEGEVTPQAETCNTTLDDDCNGQVNEGGAGCLCPPGSTASCYSGPAGTQDVGPCVAGLKTCNALGTAYSGCVGEVTPQAETCNTSIDDDCNGQVNEGGAGCACLPSSTASCYSGAAGTLGVGPCVAGLKTCNGLGTAYGACAGEVTPQAETCSTPIDDDCNGQVNESGAGCVCPPSSTASCYSGPAGTMGVGACVAGVKTCNALGTAYGTCVGEVTPLPDTCLTPADDDCNGSPLTCGGGTVCDVSGVCLDLCDPLVLGKSYLGCEYYPTVTSNSQLTPGAYFHFAITVSNVGTTAANYQVFRGVAVVSTGTVGPGSVSTVILPWINDLRSTAATLVSTIASGSGAYRLQTDRPVAVYQFNPLEYTGGGLFSYSNDASLLLPTNAWSGNYVVAARNTFATFSGFYAVTASQDATVLTLTPSATGGIVQANLAIGVNANGTGTVTLNKGDVLEVFSAVGGGTPDVSDLTGTRISATKPVQVIGGHDCTFVPWNVGSCDHLEESIFPEETLANRYLITAPLIAAATPRNQVVRIIAVLANTALSYDPPQAGAPTSLGSPGTWVELSPALGSYLVTSNQKVLIAQYMLGQQAPPGTTGDPAMTLAVGVPQYRTSYLLYAPTNYEACYVNITAPTGTTVTLDGTALSGSAFSVIGGSGFSVARVPLSNAGSGTHSVSATAAVGVSVYGYGQYTSFWYPGGLGLNTLP